MMTPGARAAAWLLLSGILFFVIAVAAGRVSESVEDRVIRSGVSTQFIQEPVRALTLRCFTPGLVERIRAQKSIDPALNECAGEAAAVLGREFAHLERQDIKAVLAMLASHHLAPVGTSAAVDFDALLKAPALVCDGYARLAAHLAGSGMRLAGFEGGVLGNHAQLFYSRADVHLLLDPTIALVALVDFDSLLSGKPVAGRFIRHFYARDELQGLLVSAIHALLNGKYRPTDLLYYFDSLDHFNERTKWYPTPGGAYQRRTRPVTPGATSARPGETRAAR
jgi:hypothetical protein